MLSLLSATLVDYGLKPWDIGLLMKEAAEDAEGFIAYAPFVRWKRKLWIQVRDSPAWLRRDEAESREMATVKRNLRELPRHAGR